LTPCVYPVIPITIAYIGSKSRGKGKLSGFILSLFFVLGLAIVYASLGVLSSMLGVSFGSLTQKPIVGVPIAIIFAILGFSMFGLFEIAMPGKFSSKIEAEKKKGKGYFGAFLIGALSGFGCKPLHRTFTSCDSCHSCVAWLNFSWLFVSFCLCAWNGHFVYCYRDILWSSRLSSQIGRVDG